MAMRTMRVHQYDLTRFRIPSVPQDPLLPFQQPSNQTNADGESIPSDPVSAVIQSENIDPLVEYRARRAKLLELKDEISECLAPIADNVRLWRMIKKFEFPRLALRVLQRDEEFGASFQEAFANHPNLVYRNKNGKLYFTEDGLTAWVYFHAELVLPRVSINRSI